MTTVSQKVLLYFTTLILLGVIAFIISDDPITRSIYFGAAATGTTIGALLAECIFYRTKKRRH